MAEGAAFESSNSASIFANSSASLKGDTKKNLMNSSDNRTFL